MCTVSLIPIAGGCRLVCNRDEQHDRPIALSPIELRFGSRAGTMPVDPRSGGTWVGVNDAGVAACLLNRYPLQRSSGRATRTTRGTIVPRVLECDAIDEAVACVNALDVGAFDPFRLVIVEGHDLALLSTDGAQVTVARGRVASPLMFTASARGDFLVEQPRRRLFDYLLANRNLWMAAQAAFHAHQWPTRRDVSVLMERADARTVSRTTIDLTSTGVRLDYEPLA